MDTSDIPLTDSERQHVLAMDNQYANLCVQEKEANDKMQQLTEGIEGTRRNISLLISARQGYVIGLVKAHEIESKLGAQWVLKQDRTAFTLTE